MGTSNENSAPSPPNSPQTVSPPHSNRSPSPVSSPHTDSENIHSPASSPIKSSDDNQDSPGSIGVNDTSDDAFHFPRSSQDSYNGTAQSNGSRPNSTRKVHNLEGNNNDSGNESYTKEKPTNYTEYNGQDGDGDKCYIVDASTLPTLPTGIMEGIKKIKSSNCCWWRSRSIHCAKCQVQPLFCRPNKFGGGYGIRRKEGGDNSIQKMKVVPGICTFCMQNNVILPNCGMENGKYKKSNKNKSKSQSCKDQVLSEYRSSYQWPCPTKTGRRKSSQISEEEKQKRQLALYSRPPWDISTAVPPPPHYESLDSTETKLSALDSILEQSKIDEYPSSSPSKKSKGSSSSKEADYDGDYEE